jgi:hypothetical protein
MLGALAQIVPDRVPAAGEGGNSVVCISGLRRNRKPFIIVDMLCGAWGGRPDRDGVEAITNPSQNLSNMPVEVLEAEHPVRVEEYGFVPDSCGAGRWRGGVGIKRSYRILADEALLQLRSDRVVFRPYGLAGGKPGGGSRSFMTRGNETTTLPGKTWPTGRSRGGSRASIMGSRWTSRPRRARDDRARGPRRSLPGLVWASTRPRCCPRPQSRSLEPRIDRAPNLRPRRAVTQSAVPPAAVMTARTSSGVSVTYCR